MHNLGFHLINMSVEIMIFTEEKNGKFFWMTVIKNMVKVLLTTSVWLFVYGWKIIENKNFISNFSHETFKAKKFNIMVDTMLLST
jgi:hypothetical protein